jgi:hypothetical protein
VAAVELSEEPAELSLEEEDGEEVGSSSAVA